MPHGDGTVGLSAAGSPRSAPPGGHHVPISTAGRRFWTLVTQDPFAKKPPGASSGARGELRAVLQQTKGCCAPPNPATPRPHRPARCHGRGWDDFCPIPAQFGLLPRCRNGAKPPVLGAGRVGCRDADLLGGTRTAAEKPLFALKPQLSLAFVKRRAWKTVGRRGPARGSVAASGPSPAAGEGFIAATDRRGVCKILQKSRFFKNQPRTPGGALRPEAGQSPGRKRESAGRAGGGPPDPAALQRRW